MTKILLVEDEQAIRRFLRVTLTANNYDFLEATSGQEGLALIASRNPSLVILDLGLPDMDGLDFTKELRSWSSVPIIVLSARGQEQDKVDALDAGADDYLTKPFGPGELLARIRVALRRAEQIKANTTESIYTFGSISVDLSKRQIQRDNEEIHLTPIEYKLLAFLIKHSGKVLTHRQLLKEVWGQAYADENHYLRVYMAQLRHKLEDEPARPQFLITEAGVGYRLKEKT
ncbi:MAG: response regulator [Candidatus Obscuribacterales bacterium]|nr:response regulator [Candidatus Obscuribacterales bacterium]